MFSKENQDKLLQAARGVVPDAPAPEAAQPSGSAQDISETCDEIKAMLLRKNAAYGDSALRPVRLFSHADAVEQIKVRLDDKISRIARGSDAGEDVVLDLIGYLVLLRIAQKRAKAST